jgi:hypothetical protein
LAPDRNFLIGFSHISSAKHHSKNVLAQNFKVKKCLKNSNNVLLDKAQLDTGLSLQGPIAKQRHKFSVAQLNHQNLLVMLVCSWDNSKCF